MSFTRTDVLLVEQPWTFGRLLLRARYRVEVHGVDDRLLAVVDEPGLRSSTAFLRRLGLSRFTAFHLRVADPDGQALLFVDKRAGAGRRPTRVTSPDGLRVGLVTPLPRSRYALLGLDGGLLGTVGDAVSIRVGDVKRRNGRRVRRDVVRIGSDVVEPARTLAVAAGLAFDIVRGKGTSHPGGSATDFVTPV